MKLKMFASCAPGLESFLATEIRQLSDSLGLSETQELEVQPGGVGFSGDENVLAHALLGLGLASRVLVRIATFPAYELSALEKHMHRLPWRGWLLPNVARTIRVTTRKSKLYHTGAVAQRIMDGIRHRMSDSPAVAETVDDGSVVKLVARMDHDRCTISLDASGDPLHRRGYRTNPHSAALREDLARAMLVASGWDQRTPLLDPMCGSGTILTEAWLMATGRSPGMNRNFGIESTAIGDSALASARELRTQLVQESNVVLTGSDRDDSAIAAARSNATNLGCKLQLHCRKVHEVPAMEEAHWIVTNPPWGGRVLKSDGFKKGTRARDTSHQLNGVYAGLGDLRRRCAAGSRLAILTSRRVLAYKTGIEMASQFLTDAGGIKVNAFVEQAK